MQPKITIVIPVYKVEKYLSECLESVINQTFQDWQAICVDDGSPDNCGVILDEYAAKDKRIKVVHQENKGLSGARNAAFDYITTPYAMFLDSDDVLHCRALEKAYYTIEKEKADMLWFDFNWFKDGEQINQNSLLTSSFTKSYKNPFKFYAIKNKLFSNRQTRMPGTVTNKIYKSEYVKQTPFATGVYPGEDNLFTLEITAKIKNLVHLKEKLYFYRIRQGSIMRSLDTIDLNENMKKEVNWYQQIRIRLIEQNVSVKNIDIFDKYLAESVFFKKLFRPFIKDNKISQSKEYIDSLIQSKIFDFNKLKPRFKFILFLYQHNQTMLSRLLSYL